MVNLDLVHSSNATLVDSQPLVAVFFGGTSGIGEYSVRGLATAHASHGKGLRVYIVGRNEMAATKIISDCAKVCPTGQFRFIRASDLSLLKEVDRISGEIMLAEEKATAPGEKAKIDLLVLTQGALSFVGRQETKEGLDSLLSLMYYSRMRIITQLLPMISISPLPGTVVSVFGPQRDTKLFPDDLSLRDPKNYSFWNVGCHVAYLTTFFLENLAASNPGVSFVHYFPGLVVTKAFEDPTLPAWFRWTWRLAMAPFVWMFPMNVPPADSGSRVLFLASPRFPPRSSSGRGKTLDTIKGIEIAISSDGVVGGGAYRVNWNGETIPTGKQYNGLREEGMSEKVWNHTMKAFKEIEAGRAFTD